MCTRVQRVLARAALSVLITGYVGSVSGRAADGAPPRGTSAGRYSTSLVNRAQYEFVHSELLYTHDGQSRQFLSGAEHDLARDNIQALFASYGLDVSLHWFDCYGLPGCNVIGELRGTTRPDDIYIVGAHFDSYAFDPFAPGADDNATGTAAVIEMARLISQWTSQATIRFIAFDCEEEWMVGSYAYAAAHASDNIVGMLAVDMLAYRNEPHNRAEVYGRFTSSGVKDPLLAALADYAGLEGIDMGPGDDDHIPFEEQGFQAALLIEPDPYDNPYIHTELDSLDHYGYIDYEYALALTRGAMGWLVDAAGVQPVAPLGDLNCDYQIDFDDIDPFVLALAGETEYYAVFPDCRWLGADANADGSVDFADVTAFIGILAGGPQGPQIAAELLPPDGVEYGAFGASVAIAGDTLVVGAYGDDDHGPGAGAAYVYERIGGVWTLATKLAPETLAAGDSFGLSVAAHDDVIAVGAPGTDLAAADAGAAYVYERTAGDWALVATLTGWGPTAGDNFGWAVAVGADTILLGAPHAYGDRGLLYYASKIGGVWGVHACMLGNAPGDDFGYSLAMSGAEGIVGRPGDDLAGPDIGSTLVVGAQTIQELRPAGGPTHGRFGTSVGIFADTAVIGAHHAPSDAGAAYVFERDGDSWSQTALLGPWCHSGPVSAAIDQNTLVIGQPTGDLPTNAGRVHVYERTDGGWTPAAVVTVDGGGRDDALGCSVAIAGHTAVAGAWWHDAEYADSGATYIIDLESQ